MSIHRCINASKENKHYTHRRRGQRHGCKKRRENGRLTSRILHRVYLKCKNKCQTTNRGACHGWPSSTSTKIKLCAQTACELNTLWRSSEWRAEMRHSCSGKRQNGSGEALQSSCEKKKWKAIEKRKDISIWMQNWRTAQRDKKASSAINAKK